MIDQERQEVGPAEILVVDDIPANLKLLTDILTDRGYRVRPASSGLLALRSVGVRLPDLILLDVKMPGMDGYEVCRRLKADEKSHGIPVIFISALDETRDKIMGFEAGGVDFIGKPFEAAEILARVETHLSLRRLQQQLEARNSQLQLEIAERKQVEEALRQSENTYRTIFENAGAALSILEEDTLISFANIQQEKLTGYSREEMENKKHWTEFVCEEDLERMKSYHTLRRVHPRLAPDHYEFRFVDRQGNIRNVIANVAMIPGTTQSVASLMDISELRRMEAELDRIRKHESIGIFAAGIAHDFNNLLGIVLGNVSLAEICMTGSISEALKSLQEAQRACLQAKDLIQRLISLTTGLEPLKRPQSVRALVADAFNLVLSGSNVRCEMDLPEGLWLVDCDPAQISQMLINLAVNARDAMGEKGTIEVSARNEQLAGDSILSLKEGKYIKLSITDHGKGIPEEHLPRIFDPYFSTKARGARKGMGLGLTTAYSIAKRHKGHISLESKVGIGTTLFVYLPALDSAFEDSTRKG